MSQSLPPRKPEKVPSGDPQAKEQDDRNHYSIDEIMDSLRDSEREKDEIGEVVTRSDGSKARKVRRRKRRSDQPEAASKKSTKEAKAQKKRKSLIIKISLVVSLVLIALLAGLFVLIRFNSDTYSSGIEEAAGEWTGSKAEFEGLRMLPGNISMTQAEFSWEEGYFTENLTLKRLTGHAGVTSFLGKIMGGQEVGGSKGTLVLRTPEDGAHWIEPLPEEDFPFNFQRYFCDGLDVIFGSSKKVKISNTHASLRYLNGSGWQLHLDEGLLALEGWQPFPLEVGLIKFHENELELSSLRLGKPEEMDSPYNSDVLVTGRIPLKPGEKATLDFEVKNYPLEGLIGDSLGSLFTGSVRVIRESKLSFTVGGDGIDEIIMPFECENLNMYRFPFMRALDELFPEKGFDRGRFNTNIEGVFRKISEGVGIENLKMSDQELLHVEGNILARNDGSLVGGMRLWISRGLLNADKKLKTHPAFPIGGRHGYSHVDIKIGGTVKRPEDTFRSVIGIDSPTNQPDTGAPSGLDFDKLTQPDPDPNPEEGKSFEFKDNTGQ